jgi:hypothetical protein
MQKRENKNYAKNTLPYTVVHGIKNKNGRKKMFKDEITKQ